MAKSVIGVDEVGRGAWAGPLLIVAARQNNLLPSTIKDSKLLSKSIREKLFFDIEIACDIGEGWVMPAEIDQLGLTKAMILGTSRALDDLNALINETIIFDGNINFCHKKFIKSSAVIDADALFPVVSAASVYAKVKRDNFMSELPARYQQYGFASHVGYGTKLHMDMLKKYGVCDIHRKSFAPIKAML
ncbi:MAG: ribonuclease HII [bacterium]|nr:ribonuclease HII [bacterium]